MTPSYDFGMRSGRRAWPIDWPTVGTAVLLMMIGLGALFSISAATGESFFKKQIFAAGIGLFVFLICSRLNFDRIRPFAAAIYGINILMLAAVLVVGKSGGGAQRWVDLGVISFQPSELSKLAIAFTLAHFFSQRQRSIDQPSTFWMSILHVLPVMGLLLLQPHIGATLSIFAIWFVTSTVAGVPWKKLAGSIIAIVAVLVGAYFAPFPQFNYAKNRISGLVSPDPQGSGYQAQQATIALALGGSSGSGYQRGEWTQSGRVPEQQNDFVFSAIGEEWGLAGGGITLVTFLAFFFSASRVSARAPSVFGRILAGGLLGVLAFHTIINLGMNLSLTPVVGLWLPFISYGGTALWMCLAAVGLISAARFYEEA